MAYYDFSVAFWDFLDSQRDRLGVFSGAIHRKKHSVIVNWLTVNFQYFISEFKKQTGENNPLPEPAAPVIWICWWDGMDTMPPVVRACYNSVVKHAGSCSVILITKYNFTDFAVIPEHIMKGFEAGVITVTHLSDIIRMQLLAGHGGLWLDASILVTGTIQPLSQSFFTIKKDFGGKDVPGRRWTGFCIGGSKKNILFQFVTIFFSEYWKKYNEMIDYFLIDYIIAVAYNSIDQIRNIIDNTDKSNPDLFMIQHNLENEFNADFFETIVKSTMFHKLTWKKRYSTVTADNKPTFYGYILEKYGA